MYINLTIYLEEFSSINEWVEQETKYYMYISLQKSEEVKIFKMHEWKHSEREILRTIWTINIAVTTKVL